MAGIVARDRASWIEGPAACVEAAAAVAAVALCSSIVLWVARANLACDIPGFTGAERNKAFLYDGRPESADFDLERVIIYGTQYTECAKEQPEAGPKPEYTPSTQSR
jgi:hypothetical protein